MNTPASAVVPSREAVDLSKFAGHTPGPWSAVLDETYCVVDAHKGRVCIATNLRGAHGLGGRRDAVEVAANARLMAAAPDLLAEVERLESLLPLDVVALDAENETLRATVADQAAALEQIAAWAKAYPLAVFPEPDWKMAASVLKANGMTLDSISASNMRHVITRVQEIVDAALAASVSSASEEGGNG